MNIECKMSVQHVAVLLQPHVFDNPDCTKHTTSAHSPIYWQIGMRISDFCKAFLLPKEFVISNKFLSVIKNLIKKSKKKGNSS